MLRNIFLLILLLTLSCSPLKMYQDLPEVKAWESDITEFEKLDVAKSYPLNAVLFAGSSSIRLWTTLPEDMKPFNVIQRGYGGAKLSDFAVYADRIINPHKCSAIVLFIANDITGGSQDKTPEEVARLFSIVLKTIRKKHPATPVFWIGITPTPARWVVWQDINMANNLIKHICETSRNTYYIRTDHLFRDAEGKPRQELFVADKLHLNEEGYKIWTGIIKNELMNVLGDRIPLR
ncbi:MAG: hypothetical protein K0B05_07150 [Bacteroidales bacterium]|nr:hypothetical protein [Bacteroidales bacterium]